MTQSYRTGLSEVRDHRGHSVSVLHQFRKRLTVAPSDGLAWAVDWISENDAGEEIVYARETVTATDVSDGTEDAVYSLQVLSGGALTEVFSATPGGVEAQSGRLDFSGIDVDSSNTGGGVIQGGTANARIIEDTASMKFISFYFDDGATSGHAAGIYDRLYVTGAGGGGDALRAFATVENVAGATARGAHISLSFAATGSISGLGAALETTLHVPNGALTGGTYTGLNVAVNSDGVDSDPAAVTNFSVIRVVNQGNATGMGKVDDKAFLFEVAGFTAASGDAHLVSSTSLAELPSNSIGLRIHVGSNVYYIPAVIAAEWN